MDITISTGDFEKVLKDVEVRQLRDPAEGVQTLGPDGPRSSVIDALPKVIAERFKKMLPPDYEIHEIELKVGISGTPFGVGVSGDATLKFGPRSDKK